MSVSTLRTMKKKEFLHQGEQISQQMRREARKNNERVHTRNVHYPIKLLSQKKTGDVKFTRCDLTFKSEKKFKDTQLKKKVIKMNG